MQVYCVTKFKVKKNSNVDTSYTPVIRYLGTDLPEAIRIAISIAPPIMHGPEGKHLELFCALPMTVPRTIIRYHNLGDVWASVAEFELEETN